MERLQTSDASNMLVQRQVVREEVDASSDCDEVNWASFSLELRNGDSRARSRVRSGSGSVRTREKFVPA